jgi:hypothetical protein
LPQEVINFFDTLAKLRLAENEAARTPIYDRILKDSSIQKVLSKIKIDRNDLVAILKIMFNDYEPANA